MKRYFFLISCMALCIMSYAQPLVVPGTKLDTHWRAKVPLEDGQYLECIHHIKEEDSARIVKRSYLSSKPLAYGDSIFQVGTKINCRYFVKERGYDCLYFQLFFFPKNAKLTSTKIADGYDPKKQTGISLFSDGELNIKPWKPDKWLKDKRVPNKWSVHGSKFKANGMILLEDFPNIPEGYGLFLDYKFRYDRDDFQYCRVEYNLKLRKKKKDAVYCLYKESL